MVFLLMLWCVFYACKPQAAVEGNEVEGQETVTPVEERPLAIENGKFFEKDGKRYLYGGEKENQHFDVTNSSLNEEQFHYGIGREKFPALISPQFITVWQADTSFEDEDRFLLLVKSTPPKAYSIRDLTRHEVVNDVVEGEPIMAAYCILADLGAIYHREIGGKEFTFALTGYTYFDPGVWDGMDGFLLWDRETESMWWPLIGESVSGALKGTPMKVMDEKYWSQTTWKDVKSNYPNARILKPGQDFTPPNSWPAYQDITDLKVDGESIAPRWGENNSVTH